MKIPKKLLSHGHKMWLMLFIVLNVSYLNAAQQSSVSQYGITWTFDGSYEVGQFANGDWWVLGPVTINSISPGWDGSKNGTMLNPVVNGTNHGFDTRVPTTTYNASLNVADDLPITVPVSTSVVSVSGFNQANSAGLYLDQIAILTVLSSAPAADAFRPPWAGTNKSIVGRVSDLDYSFLQSLPPVADAPAKGEVEDTLAPAMLDLIRQWQNTSLKVSSGGPHYGRNIAYDTAERALWLNLNHSNAVKESVLIGMVQRGIDIYGLAKYADMVWWPNGGHNVGRKLYLIIAGLALNHSDMLEWCDAEEHMVFQEDGQHFYVTQDDVDTPRHYPTDSPYTTAMIGMPEWASNALTERHQTGSQWNKPYRHVNGGANTGAALAAMLMGARGIWNNEAFFEYTDDRFWPIEEVNRTNDLNHIKLFDANMWDAYRALGDGADTVAPGTPTGFVSSSLTAYSVELSWTASTDNVGVLGYYVYVNSDNPVNTPTNSMTLTGLNPETSYAIRVSAYDAGANESSLSTVYNITTPASSASEIIAVTASDDDGNIPSNTVDANFSTRWSAQGNGQWIQYQLDDTYTVEEISLAFYNGDSRVAYFEIQTSSNANDWTTVYSGSSSGTSLALETFDLADTSAQFVRFVGNGNSSNNWNSLTEVQLTLVPEQDTTPPSVPTGLAASNVYSTSMDLDWNASSDNIEVAGYLIYIDDEEPVSISSSSVTLEGLVPQTSYTISVSAYDANGNESAQSTGISVSTEPLLNQILAAVTASGDDGNVAANTLDESFATRWSSHGNGEWIQYELDGVYVITDLAIAFYNGASRSAYFDIETSINGTSWSLLLSGAESSGTSTGFEIFDIVNTQARYIRYTGHGNSTNSWNSLTEFEVSALLPAVDTDPPTVPTGLVSGSVTQGAVGLSWNASTDNTAVAGYYVYVNGQNPITVSGTSTTVTGLTAATQYAFTVSAFDDADNESQQSTAVNVTTTSGISQNHSITGSTADVGLRSNGSLDWAGETGIRIGGANGSYDMAAVLIFQLPSIGSGETVTSASLRFTLQSIANSPNGNVDLYGLLYQSNTTVSASHYYQGAYGNDSSATAIQDNILTTSTSVGSIETNGVGSDELADYINAQYAAGAQGGDYILFRLNSDVTDETSFYYYLIATANHANVPVLEMTVTE